MDAEREKTTAEREVRVDGKRKFEVRVRFEPRGSSDVRRKLGKPRCIVCREFEST